MQDNKDERNGKIIDMFKDNSRPKKSNSSSSIKQTATGNGNFQIVGNVENLTIKGEKKTVRQVYIPVPGTIGANPTLKERINSLINELGLRRSERFGKSAYPVMINNFKKEFGIPKNTKWTTIWTWQESRAKELIDYFTSLLQNTINGRIQNAARQSGYMHTKGHLFRLEKEYLDLLEYDADSKEVRDWRMEMFGTPFRRDLDENQFRNWVEALRMLVEKQYGKDI